MLPVIDFASDQEDSLGWQLREMNHFILPHVKNAVLEAALAATQVSLFVLIATTSSVLYFSLVTTISGHNPLYPIVVLPLLRKLTKAVPGLQFHTTMQYRRVVSEANVNSRPLSANVLTGVTAL